MYTSVIHTYCLRLHLLNPIMELDIDTPSLLPKMEGQFHLLKLQSETCLTEAIHPSNSSFQECLLLREKRHCTCCQMTAVRTNSLSSWWCAYLLVSNVGFWELLGNFSLLRISVALEETRFKQGVWGTNHWSMNTLYYHTYKVNQFAALFTVMLPCYD